MLTGGDGSYPKGFPQIDTDSADGFHAEYATIFLLAQPMFPHVLLHVRDAFFVMDEAVTTPSRRRRSLSQNFARALEETTELKLSCGACSKRGPRDYQEDRFVAITDLDEVLVEENESFLLPGDRAYSFFAVYDGHSGADASSYLENNLHHAICR